MTLDGTKCLDKFSDHSLGAVGRLDVAVYVIDNTPARPIQITGFLLVWAGHARKGPSLPDVTASSSKALPFSLRWRTAYVINQRVILVHSLFHRVAL